MAKQPLMLIYATVELRAMEKNRARIHSDNKKLYIYMRERMESYNHKYNHMGKKNIKVSCFLLTSGKIKVLKKHLVVKAVDVICASQKAGNLLQTISDVKKCLKAQT